MSNQYISPCIQVCRIEQGECIGCGRTSNEITRWSRMTYFERMQVMKRLGYGTRTRTQARIAREALRRK